MRNSRSFQFTYPLERVVYTLDKKEPTTYNEGALTVECMAYEDPRCRGSKERFSAEVDRILFNGADVTPLVQHFACDTYEDIEEKAQEQAYMAFTDQPETA